VTLKTKEEVPNPVVVFSYDLLISTIKTVDQVRVIEHIFHG